MPATSFLGVLPIIPLIDICGLKAYATYETRFSVCAVALSTLSGMGVYPPVVAVEALKIRFDQAPLLLSVFPAPKERIAEASEACAGGGSKRSCLGTHGSIQASPASQPLLLCRSQI